jgi:CRP/FNR family transcriptional regulator, nitrogen oxide reductase regulator
MGNGVTPAMVEQTVLFRDIGGDALLAAAGGAARVALKSGSQLLKQGDPPRHLFMVERGKIKMSVVTSEGAQLTLRFMGPGEIIGCAAVFRGIPYPATATAVDDTAVLCWSAGQINDLVRRFPQFASNALAIVGGRAEEMLQRLREAATEKAEQRIARSLLRVADAQGAGSSPGHERVIISRQDLAELTGATLYTVSRTISRWSRQGIVAGGRGHISIRNKGRLAAIAGIVPAA